MKTSIASGLAFLVFALLGPAACAQGLEPQKFELTKAEKELLDLTNQERAKAELAPLRPNPQLFQAARGHSTNMARQSKMSHVLDEKEPSHRAREAGYRFFWLGENIAFGFNDHAEVLRVWMNSPGHRQNILNPNYTEIGLGRVLDERGVPYFTQLFGTPVPVRRFD